ncbi:MAG: malto-oligosyltrehalose synthase [Pseudomonadota bacterium]|nr:malto-oligosyltrehalose synthase [Pseudomonadota bacterium]
MDGDFNIGLSATYRLQLHRDFNFRDAAARAGYLSALGVSHLYLSPITQATPGSMHGYDVTDFDRVNPELGGEDGFRAMVAALRAAGLGVILDIVPNHMAVGGRDNRYWLDLLQKGRHSEFADFFDLDFDAPGMNGKLLVPLLGASYRDTLARGELALRRRDDADEFAILYHEHCFPLREVDQPAIRADGVEAASEPGRLHALLEAQHYRLADWRTANDLINYRRFFEITTLAGVRIERPAAFERAHRLPLQLYADGLIDGVRVDHVDGLTDPAGYCATLRAALEARRNGRPPPYLVVEKILAGDETLPRWRIDGTSGYDFMNEVSALQHSPAAAPALTQHWRDLSGRPADFEREEQIARNELLERNFAGQLESVVELVHRRALELSGDRDVTRGAMRRSVMAVIRHLRVYRAYALGGAANPGAGEALERAFAAALREPSHDEREIALLRAAMNAKDDDPTGAEAIRRFNQLTAPVAAKAVEDTAFYRYGRLLSRNDVGFDAGRLGMEIAEFHQRMIARARDWPHSLLTTATHDHKRGEDVRARLAVLSDIPDIWIGKCGEWSAMNAALRGDDYAAADEHMLLQTIVGAWPAGLSARDAPRLGAFAARLTQWQTKALREAKLRSSWLTPDPACERRAADFVAALLDPALSAKFLDSVARFVADISAASLCNSLAQTALRCLAPGVPDLYQGCELWDYSLVDPDNRRPVDYDQRENLLARDSHDEASGGVKQALIRRLLAARRAAPELFAFGDYAPIEVERREGVETLAFARRHEGQTLVAAVVLRAGAKLYGAGRRPGPIVGDARLPFDLTGFRSVWGGAGPRLAEALVDGVAVWLKT